jgi:Uncharacterized protein involved in exopolysaccharide biosynthesis
VVELREALARLIESEMQEQVLAQVATEYAFRVIDPPRVPDEVYAPKPLFVIVFAAVFGLMIGVAVALLQAVRRAKLQE